MFRQFHIAAPAVLVLFFACPVFAENVAEGLAEGLAEDDLIEFSAGEPAIADEVNGNFAVLRSAINDNHDRIDAKQDVIDTGCGAGKAIESISGNGSVECVDVPSVETRKITIQAQALNTLPDNPVYEPVADGLRWEADYTRAAHWRLPKPTDYAGGNISFTFLFRTTSDLRGTVQFFVRSGSFSGDEYLFDIPAVRANPTSTIGAQYVHAQSATIPASAMDEDWWRFVIQRVGASSTTNPETYTDAVVLQAVVIEYEVGTP